MHSAPERTSAGHLRTIGRRHLLTAGGRTASTVWLALVLTLAPAGARADIDGGRDAFNRGDFETAEAEWRPLAERGSVEGEFGLGEVYEQGRGDYKLAELWYTKAAEKGSIAALYRLALISLAGNKDVKPDPVKSYKWAILLASDAKNQWGRLPDDLRLLLETHLTALEQVEGRKQAEAWRLTKTLKAIDCAVLSDSTSALGKWVISGTVPDEAEKENLVRIASRLLPEVRPEIKVDVMPPPLCRSFLAVHSLRATNPASDQIEARLTGGASVLREGEPIRLEVKAAGSAVNVRIDYFQLDGSVTHMLPNAEQPLVKLAAGTHRVFGSGQRGEAWHAAPPFGTEFIVVAATPQPLDLGVRPESENAADYLKAFAAALRRSRTDRAQPDSLATVLVRTKAK